MKLFLQIACLLSLTALGFAKDDEPTSAPSADPIQCRVIWTGDPAHAVTISWSTDVKTASNEVLFSDRSHAGALDDFEGKALSHRDGKYTRSSWDSEETPDGFYHHARLTGLKAGSTVWFVLRSDDAVSREFHFRLATEGDEPYAWLAGGDSRTGYEDRHRMNRLMAQLVREDPRILALDHGGDYVFYGQRWDQWWGWLDDLAEMCGEDGRLLPIIPTRGNHDSGALFDEVFDTPGGPGNWYETKMGLGLTLLTLNTNVSLAGDQLTWLRQHLAEGRASSRWLMASYHQPAFPAVKTAGLARITWVPLFEAYNMDLVLESDGHVIKRTAPIRDESIDPTGVVYIGEGGLGAPQRVPRSRRWYLESPGIVARGAHVNVIHVQKDVLRVECVGYPVDDLTGRAAADATLQTFDSFELKRREPAPK